MDSILNCSKRTVSKILVRMELGCFECGWNECVCDLHHIIPRAKAGSDSHDNLTYLCPNCHRKAHNGLLTSFRNFHEVVGDTWKQFYNVNKITGNIINNKVSSEKLAELRSIALIKARETRANKTKQKAQIKLDALYLNPLNKTQYGWIQQAAYILDIAPQSVVRYLKKHDPTYLDEAKIRQSSKIILFEK